MAEAVAIRVAMRTTASDRRKATGLGGRGGLLTVVVRMRKLVHAELLPELVAMSVAGWTLVMASVWRSSRFMLGRRVSRSELCIKLSNGYLQRKGDT